MLNQIWTMIIGYVRTPAARTAEQFGDAIEDEISFHLSERTQQFIDQGMDPKEASKTAIDRFGDPAEVAAQCHQNALLGLATMHRLHLAVTTALGAAVLFLFWQSKSREELFASFSAQIPPGIASMLDNDWTGDVHGRVTDEMGNAIVGANVLVVVKTWPDGSYFQRSFTTATRRDGSFLIENVHPSDDEFEVQVAAMAENRELRSAYFDYRGPTLGEIAFCLPPSPDFAVQIEGQHGEPMVGVEVVPSSRRSQQGEHHHVYFDSAQTLIKKTDSRGRVQLPYFQDGDSVQLYLKRQDGEWVTREVNVSNPQPITLIHKSITARKAIE